jgi:glutamate transport system substrate-binding protein
MTRTTRMSAGGVAKALSVLALAALAATACGKDGSPPVKGPSAEDLPKYEVAQGFQLPQSATWRKAKNRGRLVVGAKEDQP